MFNVKICTGGESGGENYKMREKCLPLNDARIKEGNFGDPKICELLKTTSKSQVAKKI